MSQFATQLRQAREQQGLSLTEVSIETRIPYQSLIALEEGAYERLPNETAIKGFIRNYAHLLGLSADELCNLYRRERGSGSPVRVVPTSTLVMRRSYILPSFIGVFIVTIALVGLTYLFLSAVGRVGTPQVYGYMDETVHQSQTSTAIAEAYSQILAIADNDSTHAGPMPNIPATNIRIVVPSPTSEAPAGTEPEMIAGFVAATPTPGHTVGSLATPIPRSQIKDAPIVVDFSIKPGDVESWVRIIVDGTVAYEGIMVSGERQLFRAQRQINIRAGNPPVVLVGVNGLRPEPLGTVEGRPVSWSWPPR